MSKACGFAVWFDSRNHDKAGDPSCLLLSGLLHINRKKVSKRLGLNRCTCVNAIMLVSASSFSLSGDRYSFSIFHSGLLQRPLWDYWQVDCLWQDYFEVKGKWDNTDWYFCFIIILCCGLILSFWNVNIACFIYSEGLYWLVIC